MKPFLFTPSRRQYLKMILAVVASLVGLGWWGKKKSPWPSPKIARLELLALAEAVLPPALTIAEVNQVVDNLLHWTTNAAPRKTYEKRYQDELVQLASGGKGLPLSQLTIEERRELVRNALTSQRTQGLVSSLLTIYFRSPEGVNACYGVRVNPYTARPLLDSLHLPESIT